MREIKFRAWNIITKTIIDLKKCTPLALNMDTNGLFIPFSDGLPLMQFTGLKDKNGKEIWEGDIVVRNEYIWFDKNKPNYRGTVEWIYSQWQVVAHCVNPQKRGTSDGINGGLNDDGIDEGEKSEWEVIGNVYENPELLKGQP